MATGEQRLHRPSPQPKDLKPEVHFTPTGPRCVLDGPRLQAVLCLTPEEQQDTVIGHPVLPVQQAVVGQQVQVFVRIGTSLYVYVDDLLERFAQSKDNVRGRLTVERSPLSRRTGRAGGVSTSARKRPGSIAARSFRIASNGLDRSGSPAPAFNAELVLPGGLPPSVACRSRPGDRR
jgi:hypothetical protein